MELRGGSGMWNGFFHMIKKRSWHARLFAMTLFEKLFVVNFEQFNQVGRQGEDAPFMEIANPESITVKCFAIRTGYGSDGYWHIGGNICFFLMFESLILGFQPKKYKSLFIKVILYCFMLHACILFLYTHFSLFTRVCEKTLFNDELYMFSRVFISLFKPRQ